MDDLAKQIDEIEALASIYGSDWIVDDESSRSYNITIKTEDLKSAVTLYLTLPNDYPSCSPPQFQISAPDLTRHMKNIISNELNNTYLENIGEPLIYQWIEKVRDIIEADSKTETNINSTNEPEVVCTNPEEYQNVHLSIIHGPLIQDRKSTFQGHVAPVHSKEDVDQMLNALLQNRKISQATHNILAYRIEIQNTKIILQDCDDDGEVNAGGRLLHLLNVLHVTNVAVVVSRWYGGIHLGPDRFRHINNAARQVLEIANLIKPGK